MINSPEGIILHILRKKGELSLQQLSRLHGQYNDLVQQSQTRTQSGLDTFQNLNGATGVELSSESKPKKTELSPREILLANMRMRLFGDAHINRPLIDFTCLNSVSEHIRSVSSYSENVVNEAALLFKELRNNKNSLS